MRQFLFLTLILCALFSQKMVAEFSSINNSNSINTDSTSVDECELTIYVDDDCDPNTSVHDVVFSISGGSGDYEIFVNGSTNGELNSGTYYAVIPGSEEPYTIMVLDLVTNCVLEGEFIFSDCGYGSLNDSYLFLINSEIANATCGENNGSIEIGLSPGCFFNNWVLYDNDLWSDWVEEGINADPQWDDYATWSQFTGWEEWLYWASDNFTGQENWFEAYYSFLEGVCSYGCVNPSVENCLIQDLEYEWYDIAGNLVSTEEDPSNLSAGVYDLYIQTIEYFGFEYFANFVINENMSDVETTVNQLLSVEPSCSFLVEVNDYINNETSTYPENISLSVELSEDLPAENLVWYDFDGTPLGTGYILENVSFSDFLSYAGMFIADSTFDYWEDPFLGNVRNYEEYILEVADLEGCVSYYPYSFQTSQPGEVILDILDLGDNINAIYINIYTNYGSGSIYYAAEDYIEFVNEDGNIFPLFNEYNEVPDGNYTMTITIGDCSQTIDIVLGETGEAICDFETYQVVGEYNPDTGNYPVQYFVLGQAGQEYSFEMDGMVLESQTADSTGIFSFETMLSPNANTFAYDVLITDGNCSKLYSLVLPEPSLEYCSFQSDIFAVCDGATYEIGISILGEPNETYEFLFMGVLDTTLEVTSDSIGIVTYTSPIYENGTGFTVFISNESCTVYRSIPMIDCSTGLSVRLLDFEATATSKGNLLEWETASVEKGQYFEIEHSKDGSNFDKIATVKVNQNNNQTQSFSFTDTDIENCESFYRLKLINEKGKELQVSKVRSIDNCKDGKILLVNSVYPNPSNGPIKINGFLPVDGMVQITIFDMLGQEAFRMSEFRPSGLNIFELDFSNMNTGNYMVQVTHDNQQKIERVVKL